MIPYLLLVAFLAHLLGYSWGMRTHPTRCPGCDQLDPGIGWVDAIASGLFASCVLVGPAIVAWWLR